MKTIIQAKIRALAAGQISEKEFLRFFMNFPYSNEPDLKLDFQREIRRGTPEVVYGQGKNLEQLIRIVERFREVGSDMLITRLGSSLYLELKKKFSGLVFHSKAGMVTFARKPRMRFKKPVLVVSAGASDETVAEEAAVSALYLGNRVEKEYDVGVACISRILALRAKMNRSAVIIAIAGMEGALPSVIAGLTATPVIAVPTSVGYGANFGGISALLAMLNSCSGGVSVVNIDNGFGAAYLATLINQKIAQKKG